MTRLSSDLITEVLSRLPPKSLLRFRCASKSWCSEIDAPEFINLHIRHSVESGSHQALTFSSEGQVQLFEHVSDFPIKPSSAKDLTPQVRPLSRTRVRFIGSSRGLIALAIKGGGIVIWNPFTRKRWIPPVPRESRKSIFGFGYDTLSDDYKLVRIHGWFQENVLDFKVSVYSFKSNSWRPVISSPNPFQGRSWVDYGLLAHDAVHFATDHRYLNQDNEFEFYIKAFDLHTEKFRDLVVKLPSHEDGGEIGLDVTVLRGHFSIVRFGGGETEAQSIDMAAWVLKDYSGDEESWTMLFRVSLPWFALSESMPPLECGNSVLLNYSGCCFAWIDLETMSVEEVRVEADQAIKDATLLVASIESLGVGTADKRTFPERMSRKRRRVRRHGW